MVLRDGTMRGGGGFYFTVGSYTCSDGKWKGEMISREHSPIAGTYPWARKEISIGLPEPFLPTLLSWMHGISRQAKFSIQIKLQAASRGLIVNDPGIEI